MAEILSGREVKQRGFWQLVWEGIWLARDNPYIMLSYLGKLFFLFQPPSLIFL